MMNASSDEILFCFTVDTDSDSFFGDVFSEFHPSDKSIRGWSGLESGKDIIADIADGFRDSYGNSLKVTWFIRCDYQLEATYGNCGYLLRSYNDWWEERLEKGDDLQWHAHLYSCEKGIWHQETDIVALARDLSIGKKSFEEHGLSPLAIRIGEAYHSNELMAFLKELGLSADCTAIPGRKRMDKEKILDWESTPNHPYCPSLADYRAPGNPSFGLWEIPMNTVSTRTTYDVVPLLRYVNPAFHPAILHEGLLSFIPGNDLLVSILHPFEVLSEFYADSKMTSHPLLAFSPDAVKENIRTIMHAARSTGKKVRFVTMSKVIAWLES